VIRHRPKGIRFASQIRDGKTADLLLFCFVHLSPLASVRKKMICFGIRGTARAHTHKINGQKMCFFRLSNLQQWVRAHDLDQ
jgi:hypothetical protein